MKAQTTAQPQTVRGTAGIFRCYSWGLEGGFGDGLDERLDSEGGVEIDTWVAGSWVRAG